jgi:hypothetical protein
VTIDGPGRLGLPALPPEVLARIAAELPGRGDKAAACVATASSLIEQGAAGVVGLRLAESAAYNLREALDAVVSGREAAAGGLSAVLQAWARYQTEQQQPEADREASRTALAEVLNRVAEDQDRSSWRARQLLEYLRAQTGVDPLSGDLDPIVGYAALRADANNALHTDCTLAEVISLLDRTVSWFVRMFTPPDHQVRELRELASQPYEGSAQVEKLRGLATNAHHLKLFLGQVTDPAWLDALYETGIIQLPEPGQPWPVTNVIGGLGVTHPQHVADLLNRFFGDTKNVDKSLRLGMRVELLRAASQLGSAGYPVAAQVISLHGSNHWIQTFAVNIAKNANPSDAIVAKVADAVLGSEPDEDRGSQSIVILHRLVVGLSAENAAARIQLVAAKVRRLASAPRMKFVAMDVAALTTELVDDHESVVILAHHLVRLAARARELGVSTPQLQDWLVDIPGEIGERITCQLLAGATDLPLSNKIKHIALRLGSHTATGDDRDLINDVLSFDPTAEQLEVWAAALGDPTPTPETPADTPPFPNDWARVWRWSMVLPADTVTRWREPIAQVTAHYGEPSISALDTRLDRSWFGAGRSPHSIEELSALPVLEAASLISEWRPDSQSGGNLVSARELARALEDVVKADLDGWTEDPAAIVTSLREPVYVLHYLQALAANAAGLTERAVAILSAARLVRDAQWEPATIGRDDFDFEPRWDGVDVAIVDLIGALANKDGRLAGLLDEAWDWVLKLTGERPPAGEFGDPLEGGDALNSAINRNWGRGFEAVLALAGWEARNVGEIRPAFEETLDEVVHLPGTVGMEYRAILAARRPFLEVVAPRWMDTNANVLFREDPAGQPTFDLTLKWSRPTSWFLSRFRSELLGAAQRGAEHAVTWLLIGALRGEHGYGLDGILGRLHGDVAALNASAAEVALLVQDAEPDAPELSVAIAFWRALLDADLQAVPLGVLHALGRWAFVTGVDEADWAELMHRTLELTDGQIDYSIEVADRCKAMRSCGGGPAMLRLLLGRGEPWERDYIEHCALDVLRDAAQQPNDHDFWRLRTRLIELGRHEAVDIILDGKP